MLHVTLNQNHSNKLLPSIFYKFSFVLFCIAPFFIIISCGGPPQYIDEGQESPAVLAVSGDSTTNFGETLNGFSYQRTITIQNISSTVPADNVASSSVLATPFSYTGGSYPGTGGTCQGELDPLDTCTINIDINPTVNGVNNSSITLNYYDGLTDQSLDLSLITSVRDPLPAMLAITPAGNQDYGIIAIGGFSDASFTVTNTGELSATAVNFSGLSAPFSMTSNSCGASLAAGATCELTVRFTPTAQAVINQVLSLSYHDSQSLQSLNKNFQGEGRVAGFLAIDQGLNFDFGLINNGFVVNQTLTVRNTGGGNATSISFNGLSAPMSVVSNNCPATLTPAQSCTVQVRYSPTSTVVTNQNFNIPFFDGFSNQNVVIGFTGQGFANSLNLSLISPASSPSNQSTPTIRVDQLIPGIRIRLYSNAACSAQIGNALSVGTSLDFMPVFAEGIYQIHARAEDESGNLSACSASVVNYQYDNTNPNSPSNVNLTANFTSSSSTTPNFTWNSSSSGDVVDYQVGISTSAAGGNSSGGWDSKGVTNSANLTGLSMSECTYYFVSVRAIDHVGLISSHSVSASSFRYDTAIPTAPSNLAESGDASDTNSATVDWTASSDNCGISHYEVAISEDTSGNGSLDAGEIGNVVSFTNVGLITSHRFNGLSLTTGVNHYTSIRAVDTTGRISTANVSQPWIIYNPSIELPDMIAWLDANDPSTILDAQGDDANSGAAFSGTVDRWLDKSGSAVNHHFDVSGSSAEPSYNGTNFSVDFNGTNTGMTTPNHSEINTALVNQRNITVAFRTSADITSRQVLYEEGGNVRGMNIYINGGQLYCGFYNTPAGDGDGVQPFTWVNTAISTNTVYFVTWVFDYTNYTGPAGPDGSLDCYINGALFGSTPTTSRLFGHSGAVGLGHINGQSCFEDTSCPGSGSEFLGSIYEVMLFNNAPDAADVSNVHTYLDNKWN